MRVFPSEFRDLVKPSIWRARKSVVPISGDRNRVRWFPLGLRPEIARDGVKRLDAAMTSHLRNIRGEIDPQSILGMKENYSEVLPKTMRNSTASLNRLSSAAACAAREIGLIDLMMSGTLQEFAEGVSGCRLKDDPGLQVIRYMAGDYVGPHNDHHPENENLRDGYVDLQITLSNDGVARQYFVYECNGFFNQTCNVGIASGISVSMLPFWHQVTPLEVKPGRTQDARRWLLLVSFEIARGGNGRAKA